MKLEYRDRKKLGDFVLGMNVNDLNDFLQSSYREKKSLFFTGRVRRFYQNEGLFFDIRDNSLVEAIEITKKNKVFFQGNELFSMSKGDIKKLLFSLDPLTIEKDGFLSKELGISFFIEPGKEKPSSILFFLDGYYEQKQDFDPVKDTQNDISIDDLYTML